MNNDLIFDTTYASFLDSDEFQAILLLEEAFKAVAEKYGDITEENLKIYSSEHPDSYQFKISMSTFRNYLQRKNYKIQKDAPFIIKELSIREYIDLCKNSETFLDSECASHASSANDNVDNNFLNPNSIFTDYAIHYSSSKELKSINARCTSNAWENYQMLCSKIPFIEKSYLFSFVLTKGVDMTLKMLNSK